MKKLVLLIAFFYVQTYSFGQCAEKSFFDFKTAIIDSLDVYKHVANLETNEYKQEYKYLENMELNEFYYCNDGLSIKAYMIKPKNFSGKLPVLIFNRGGNRNFGMLDHGMLIYNLGLIANQGYVVVGSTYRGNTDSEGTDEFGGKDVNDVINLINVLNNFDFIDTERIALYGWSRGGIMTYKTLREMRNRSSIKTAIIGGAPSDLLLVVKNRPGFEKKVISNLIPNYEENKINLLKDRSVIYWANKLPKIPLLLIHGINDERVEFDQVIELSKELQSNEIPFKLVIYEKDGHNIKKDKNEFNMLLSNWLIKYL